jgi:hypothetical protein
VTVTCFFCDFDTLEILAELPVNGVKWTDKLDDLGSWSGTLNVAAEPPTLPTGFTGYPPNLPLNWKAATTPELTAVFVDVDGTIVWGGWTLTRNYTRSSGIVSLTATSFWGYIGTRRIQAQDYTSTWSNMPFADPMLIAAVVVAEALDVADSGMPWLNIVVNGATPAEVWAPVSWPISQEQNVGSLVSQLQAMGYGIGFDFGIDCAWADQPGGGITVTLNLSFPVRGRDVADSGLVIDVSQATDFTWVEDGSGNANHVIETGTSTGSIAAELLNADALAAGYPLLDAVLSNPATNSTPVSQGVINAYAADDMATGCYPATPASVILPMFPQLGSSPSITDYRDGDQVRLVVPRWEGPGTWGDPYFPGGLDVTMRIAQIDANPGDAGLGTVTLTLVPPASADPIPIPV